MFLEKWFHKEKKDPNQREIEKPLNSLLRNEGVDFPDDTDDGEDTDDLDSTEDSTEFTEKLPGEKGGSDFKILLEIVVTCTSHKG